MSEEEWDHKVGAALEQAITNVSERKAVELVSLFKKKTSLEALGMPFDELDSKTQIFIVNGIAEYLCEWKVRAEINGYSGKEEA